MYKAATEEITIKTKMNYPSVRGCYSRNSNKRKIELAPVYEAATVEITIKKMN